MSLFSTARSTVMAGVRVQSRRCPLLFQSQQQQQAQQRPLLFQSQLRRLKSSKPTPPAEAPAAAETAAAESAAEAPKATGMWSDPWNSAEFWGAAGALAGWGMTGAAIWDASTAGPELISLNMTSVMIVYSSLFCRWAYIVTPQNLLLSACHGSNVLAQCNQMRRAVEHKLSKGESAEVNDLAQKAGVGAAGIAALIAGGPTLQGVLVSMELGPLSAVAGAAAGPFTTHFWAPMSKWLISGASFMDLERPTDKISLAQYTALTLTGAFFSRYALLVTPVNYTLCSVNIALFGSSAWHLGRKIKADFIDDN